jgi:hypothetical protein
VEKAEALPMARVARASDSFMVVKSDSNLSDEVEECERV